MESLGDQGPWGGTRIIHWEADQDGTFSVKEIIRFAEVNEWSLAKDTVLSSVVVSKRMYQGNPVFPIDWTGFHPDMTPTSSKFADFPRWINGEVRVLAFTTTWINVEPGIGESHDINGYAILNREKTELTVYHMWGE